MIYQFILLTLCLASAILECPYSLCCGFHSFFNLLHFCLLFYCRCYFTLSNYCVLLLFCFSFASDFVTSYSAKSFSHNFFNFNFALFSILRARQNSQINRLSISSFCYSLHEHVLANQCDTCLCTVQASLQHNYQSNAQLQASDSAATMRITCSTLLSISLKLVLTTSAVLLVLL